MIITNFDFLGCPKLTYYPTLEVHKNYFKKELTLKESKNKGCSYLVFGMTMPGRSFTSESYRFGFNGMEKDGEDWTGSAGNQLDFGARIYDSRLGRWLSVDPEFKIYPNNGPYNFSINNPIKFIDSDGGVVTDENGNIIYTVDNPNSEYVQSQKYDNGVLYTWYFKAEKGRILTDAGNEVIVYKATSNEMYERAEEVVFDIHGNPQYDYNGNLVVNELSNKVTSGNFDCSHNCTGNALTDKQFTIGSDEITPQYLKDEGLEVVTVISGEGASDFLQNSSVTLSSSKGNVGMYIDGEGLVHHLEPFVTPTSVSTKGGIQIDPGPAKPGASETFGVGAEFDFGNGGVRTIENYSVYTKTQDNTTITSSDYGVSNDSNSGTNKVSNQQFKQIKKDVKKH